MQQKKVLFIDFDGTLCHDHFFGTLSSDVRERIDRYLFHENEQKVNEWMRGKLSSEEIVGELSRELDLDYQLLWDSLTRDCQTMTLTVLPQRLLEIRKDFVTVLMTDNMDCLMRYTVPALKLNDCFDRIVCSSDVGLLKKDADGESFKRVAKLMHMQLSESLLIDNSKNSCDTFTRLGGHSLFVDRQHSLAYWLQKLKDSGVSCV